MGTFDGLDTKNGTGSGRFAILILAYVEQMRPRSVDEPSIGICV